MSEDAICLANVTRAFGSTVAVEDLRLTIPVGSIFGLLGANGAGKTTTIRMIVGHLHPGAGAVRVLGSDPWLHDEATRARVAYVSENMALPAWMSAEQGVSFCRSLYPAWDDALARELIAEFGVPSGRGYGRLSKGQKRALCLILALCRGADLLVMDEPGAGLDVMARRKLLSRILDVACEGRRTVLLSSHIITDLERVVDRVAFLREGRLALAGGLEDLKQSVRRLSLPGGLPADALERGFRVLRHEASAGRTEAVVTDFDRDRFGAFCSEHGCTGSAEERGMNLEDMFVEVAGATAAGEE